MPNDLRQAADELPRPAAHPLRRTVRGRAVHHQQQRRQLPHRPDRSRPGNVAWNARGSGEWRLVGCAVTSAFGPGGAPAAVDDPVRRLVVADSDRQAPAKLVDLDPQQQLASTIWGLEVRLAEPDGRTRLVGRFAPASFTGIWIRAARRPMASSRSGPSTSRCSPIWSGTRIDDSCSGPQGRRRRLRSPVDQVQCGRVREQRCLRGVHPGPTGRHARTRRGRRASAPGDRPPADRPPDVERPADHRAAGQDQLLLGRGRRGPQDAHHRPGQCPHHRHPRWKAGRSGSAHLELSAGRTTSDRAGHDQLHRGSLVCRDRRGSQPEPERCPAGGAAQRSAGRPAGPGPGRDERRRATAATSGPTRSSAASTRSKSRPYRSSCRSSRPSSVVRCPGCPSARSTTRRRCRLPPPGSTLPAGQFSAQLPPTDATGRTVLTVTAHDPGNPRGAIDGQLFGLRLQFGDGPQQAPDLCDLISLLVSDAYDPDPPITWHAHIRPIFTQYAHLYPVMDDFLDLADYEAVCANRELLAYAFDLDVTDPNSMPVTRDLSSGQACGDPALAERTRTGRQAPPRNPAGRARRPFRRPRNQTLGRLWTARVRRRPGASAIRRAAPTGTRHDLDAAPSWRPTSIDRTRCTPLCRPRSSWSTRPSRSTCTPSTLSSRAATRWSRTCCDRSCWRR